MLFDSGRIGPCEACGRRTRMKTEDEPHCPGIPVCSLQCHVGLVWADELNAPVAQCTEHQPSKLVVTGSSPVGGTDVV